MLINLPSTDELYVAEAGLRIRCKREIAVVPRKMGVVDVGELFHKHPHSMRTLGQAECGRIFAIVFDGEPAFSSIVE